MADIQPDANDPCIAAVRAAVPDLQRILADPLLGDERPKLFLDRVLDCVRDLHEAAGVPLSPDELQTLRTRERGFVTRELGRLRQPAPTGSEGPTLPDRLERIVWVVWRKSVRWRRGGGLTPAEKKAFGALFAQHDENVVRCVRSQLRRVARERGGATISAVAQSVWESAMSNHPDEVNLSNPDSVWCLLLEIGKRHCERWNKVRHPQDSLDAPTGRPGGAAPAEPLAATLPADSGDVEDEVILRECVELLQAADGGPAADERTVAHLAAHLPDTDEGLGLWKQLTPLQRSVLLLKVFDRTAAEIAATLELTQAQVNYAWNGIKETARAMAAS